MRALLDMQKEIMADQAKRDFNAAFIALQADLSHVSIRQDGKIEVRKKDSSGERTGAVQQATPYATFNNIMKAIRPLLVKHGFTLSFATEPMGERLLVKGLLEGYGHERTTAFPLPAETSGSKNNVQGWGSVDVLRQTLLHDRAPEYHQSMRPRIATPMPIRTSPR
jgi:hypothetical protein